MSTSLIMSCISSSLYSNPSYQTTFAKFSYEISPVWSESNFLKIAYKCSSFISILEAKVAERNSV